MALNDYVKQYAQKFQLTERENDVLFQLTNRNVSPQDIGKALNISLHTVNNHLKKILEKTNSDSKTELLADFLLFLEQQKFQIESVEKKPKVLILDDESDLTELLAEYLKTKGIICYREHDPLAALDAVKKLELDVVISDIKMPKLDGVGFLKKLRELHYYRPGLVFISAYPKDYQLEKLLDYGAFAFFEKPIDLEKLNRVIWEFVLGANTKGGAGDSHASIRLGNVDVGIRQLGFGGFFLPQKELSKNAGIILNVGGKIDVTIHIPNLLDPVKTICEVVWKREDGDPTLAGYGLKFLDLDLETKNQVFEIVKSHNILSFIPKGSLSE
ncbi:MAG: response regulator [Oligoflexia bacterium]|nr:response regulator [Oligoflexia bacterium]